MPDLDKDQLIKLIRLLSSNQDGERLGAVYAIERILKAANLDWHDLAETIANKVIEVTKVQVIHVSGAASKARKWIEAADRILEYDSMQHVLQDRELEFINDMRTRFDLRPDFVPSEKQTNWFMIIYRRTAGRGEWQDVVI